MKRYFLFALIMSLVSPALFSWEFQLFGGDEQKYDYQDFEEPEFVIEDDIHVQLNKIEYNEDEMRSLDPLYMHDSYWALNKFLRGRYPDIPNGFTPGLSLLLNTSDIEKDVRDFSDIHPYLKNKLNYLRDNFAILNISVKSNSEHEISYKDFTLVFFDQGRLVREKLYAVNNNTFQELKGKGKDTLSFKGRKKFQLGYLHAYGSIPAALEYKGETVCNILSTESSAYNDFIAAYEKGVSNKKLPVPPLSVTLDSNKSSEDIVNMKPKYSFSQELQDVQGTSYLYIGNISVKDLRIFLVENPVLAESFEGYWFSLNASTEEDVTMSKNDLFKKAVIFTAQVEGQSYQEALDLSEKYNFNNCFSIDKIKREKDFLIAFPAGKACINIDAEESFIWSMEFDPGVVYSFTVVDGLDSRGRLDFKSSFGKSVRKQFSKAEGVFLHRLDPEAQEERIIPYLYQESDDPFRLKE